MTNQEIMAYHGKVCTGMILNLWPIKLDHYNLDRSSKKDEFEIVVQANTSTKLVESNSKTIT
jgi:hypothetical protein